MGGGGYGEGSINVYPAATPSDLYEMPCADPQGVVVAVGAGGEKPPATRLCAWW